MSARVITAIGCILCACGDRGRPEARASPPPATDSATRPPSVHLEATPLTILAVRTESAPWQVLAATGDRYELPALGERFTIAAVCARGSRVEVALFHASRGDRLDLHTAGCGVDGRVTLQPRFARDRNDQRFELDRSLEYCEPGRFSCDLPAGVHDGYAMLGAGAAMRMRILRRLRIAEGVVIDADASGGFSPETAQVTVWRAAPGPLQARVCFTNPHGGGALCDEVSAPVVDERAQLTYRRVPHAERRPDECDLLESAGLLACLGDARVVVDVRAGGPAAVDRDARRITWTAAPGDAALELRLGAPSGEVRYLIRATRGWLGAQAGYALPELGDLPGWTPAWNVPLDEVEVAIGRGDAPLAESVTTGGLLRNAMRPGESVQWFRVPVAGTR